MKSVLKLDGLNIFAGKHGARDVCKNEVGSIDWRGDIFLFSRLANFFSSSFYVHMRAVTKYISSR